MNSEPVMVLGPALEGCKDSAVPELVEGRIHVLLVDDDTLARHVISKALQKFGYQVTVVVSAQQALQALESSEAGTFQLILSDVVMPQGGDGLDLLEQLKSNPAWESIPVVMMSANDCVDTVRECLQQGACHYILKPATHKEIKNIWQYAFWGSTVSLRPCVPGKHAPSIPAPNAALPAPDHPSTATPADTPTVEHESSHPLVHQPAPDLPPHHPASASISCNLNSVLESNCLPWKTRLSIFCRLLHNTMKASQSITQGRSAASAREPAAACQLPTPLPFSCPASVLVSSSAEVSTCSARCSHFSTPLYDPPEHHSPATGATPASRPFDPAQATYALGLLLMELAMAPVSPADRKKHLTALPRLPVQLLASKPKIAVLILQMTAERPQDRLPLEHVAIESSIAEVYNLVASEDASTAAAAAAERAQLRRSFLTRVAAVQRTHVTAVSNNLRRIEEDMRQITQALKRMEVPVSGPTATASPTQCDRAAHGDCSSQQQYSSAALHGFTHGTQSAQACIADGRASCCELDACAMECGPPAHASEAGASGSEEGSNQQRTSGAQEGLCTASTTANPPQRMGSGSPGFTTAPARLATGNQPIGDTHQHCAAPSCGAEAPHRAARYQCRQQAQPTSPQTDQQPMQQHAEQLYVPSTADAASRGVKRGRPCLEAAPSAPTNSGCTQSPDTPGTATAGGCAVPVYSVAAQVPRHVQERWQHVEPVAMHLFESYCNSIPKASSGGSLLDTQMKTTNAGSKFCGAPACPCILGCPARTPGMRSVCSDTTGICPEGLSSGRGMRAAGLQPWLESISSDLQAVSRYRSLELVSVVPTLDVLAQPSRRMVSAVAFDRCDHIMAVVGISKPVRLYRFSDICSGARSVRYAHYPVAELNLRTKPTSACFNPYLQHRLVVADTEGGVMIMDTNMQHDVMQLEEHSSRVWAVDSSPHDPALLLSASADRTVRLWRANAEKSVGVIVESSQVCSAAFCPTDANLLAVGTGSFTRLYDVRRMDAPLGSVTAPKAVSYVRFMGKHIVTASVDSVLCMYDTSQVARAATLDSVQPVREFRGHLNTRNFVGLACSPTGYMFTGSENKSIVMYHRSVPAPVAEQVVSTSEAMAGGGPEATVSCVAASEALGYVVTGTTTGWVNIMKMQH